MKKLQNCETENCIPTPSSCTEWNGGDIECLGICNGTSLNNVVVEIATKLCDIIGDDLSSFDIDSLVDICKTKAPLEVTLLSILNLLKDNDICLKDYINTLNDKIAELTTNNSVKVNLKCYADIDNLGNVLSITREQLDQLVINELCNHKQRIESIEGDLLTVHAEIQNLILNPVIDELTISVASCINSVPAPTSTQVIKTAQTLCDLQTATGTPTNIATALANTPGDLNPEFGLIPGWILTPTNWVDNYSNMLLEVEALRQRLITIETTCCQVSCKDVKIGFVAAFNPDNDGIIIKFTGAGTEIPVGFLDLGSTITFTDEEGNVEEFTTTAPDLIANNAIIEIPISTLLTSGDVNINIDSNMSNGSLTCSKCLNKTIKRASCAFCVLTATSEVTIVYKTCTSSGV